MLVVAALLPTDGAEPTPEEIAPRTTGSTAAHVGHHDAVHNVMSGWRAEALRRIYVCRSPAYRTLVSGQ